MKTLFIALFLSVVVQGYSQSRYSAEVSAGYIESTLKGGLKGFNVDAGVDYLLKNDRSHVGFNVVYGMEFRHNPKNKYLWGAYVSAKQDMTVGVDWLKFVWQIGAGYMELHRKDETTERTPTGLMGLKIAFIPGKKVELGAKVGSFVGRSDLTMARVNGFLSYRF